MQAKASIPTDQPQPARVADDTGRDKRQLVQIRRIDQDGVSGHVSELKELGEDIVRRKALWLQYAPLIAICIAILLAVYGATLVVGAGLIQLEVAS